MRIDYDPLHVSDNLSYPPSTTRPTPTPIYDWHPFHRPPPRPITLSHDESKLYYPAKKDPAQLEFYKGADGDRGQSGEKAERQYMRDEL